MFIIFTFTTKTKKKKQNLYRIHTNESPFQEYRHIEGRESAPAGCGDCDCLAYEEIFRTDDDLECEGAATPLYTDPFDDEFDYNFGQSEEQSQLNRLLAYRHHPELFIDDDEAGFPALHEIGETIDELQLIMHAYIMKYSLNI